MNKTKSIRVRLTDEEWDAAEKESLKLFGMPNKSKLIRKLLRNYIGMGPDISENELKLLRESVRQLTGISRNLNQITARLNSGETNVSHLKNEYLLELKNYVSNVNHDFKKLIESNVKRFQEIVNNE